jgi:hypothetical protein
MSKKKIVTEQDFRKPEFSDANPEDYEFRDDGVIVRKDRWKTGIFKIASLLDFSVRDGFEIDQVVEAVRELVEESEKKGGHPPPPQR